MEKNNTNLKEKISPLQPILIVDDDIDLLHSLELTLLATGLNNIICCPDSRKVSGIVKSEAPCLILLDIAMPHMTGEEVLKSVRIDFPHIPVIVITGSPGARERIEWKDLGAFDFLLKPIEQKRLSHAVNSALRRE